MEMGVGCSSDVTGCSECYNDERLKEMHDGE